MFSGVVYIETDIVSAVNLCLSNPRSQLLYIGEEDIQLPIKVTKCSVLLPPFEALDAETNGDVGMYTAYYQNHLATEVCYDLFTSILIALYNNFNIVLYIENGNELLHGAFLKAYLQNVYGITASENGLPGGFNMAFMPQTACMMYSYMDGFMSLQQLLQYIPDISFAFAIEESTPFTKPVSQMMRELNVSAEYILNNMNKFRQASAAQGVLPQGALVAFTEGE